MKTEPEIGKLYKLDPIELERYWPVKGEQGSQITFLTMNADDSFNGYKYFTENDIFLYCGIVELKWKQGKLQDLIKGHKFLTNNTYVFVELYYEDRPVIFVEVKNK